MVKEYKKGVKEAVSKSFFSTDFDCNCRETNCTTTLIDSDLIDGLELLQIGAGMLSILSGYRCSTWNRIIGGKPGSYHMVGKAADVKSRLETKYLHELATRTEPFSRGGIGHYSSFVHVDCRGKTSRWEG